MRIEFWGARGSVPSSHKGTMKYGGNTACVEVRTRCRVREITVGPDGMATGVIYYDADGKEVFQPSEIVIMACNGTRISVCLNRLTM